MSSRPSFAARDAWEWLGIAAWLIGGLLILADLATDLDRHYPGSLILLGIGGTLLLTYRSATGLFASRPPTFRRALGLAIAIPGFFLALLEVTR
jgi:hypothetical protein